MKYESKKEYIKEINRVQEIINTTQSRFLKKDSIKYLKTLKREFYGFCRKKSVGVSVREPMTEQ